MEEEVFGIDQVKKALEGAYQGLDTIDDVIDDNKINWADGFKLLGIENVLEKFRNNPELVEQVKEISAEENEELNAFKDELAEQFGNDEERDRATITLTEVLNVGLAINRAAVRIAGAFKKQS